MKNKYLLTAVLSLGLTAIALVGCGNSNDSATDEDDVVILTFFSADGLLEMNFDDAIAEEITRRTGVRLEISAPMAGDEAQDIALMVSQNEYPDLIYAKSSIDLLVNAGAVLPLDDLIEEKGEHLKALYGDKLGRLRYTLDDPAIYHVGTGPVNERITETSGTAQIQMEVMRELGFPELKTLEDFENAIKMYMEANPTINDQDTIGLSLLGSDWRWLITVGNPAGMTAGLPDDGEWYINEETGEATIKYLLPEFRDYFRWLNRMNAEGILDPESFTHTYDTYLSKLSSGRVLAVMDADWNIDESQIALVADSQPWRTFMPLPITQNENSEPLITRPSGFYGMVGVSIAANSDQANKAFEFLDWMASEEAQILVNWGIEGVHYEYVDGVRTLFPEVVEERNTNPHYSRESGVGEYIHPFPVWGNAAVDSTGNLIVPDSPEQIMANYNEAERETLSAYGVDFFINLFPTFSDFEGTRHGQAWAIPIPADTSLALTMQRMGDFVQQGVTQAILADSENFDEAWDEVIEGLESLGAEAANTEMTQLVQDRIKLWEME